MWSTFSGTAASPTRLARSQAATSRSRSREPHASVRRRERRRTQSRRADPAGDGVQHDRRRVQGLTLILEQSSQKCPTRFCVKTPLTQESEQSIRWPLSESRLATDPGWQPAPLPVVSVSNADLRIEAARETAWTHPQPAQRRTRAATTSTASSPTSATCPSSPRWASSGASRAISSGTRRSSTRSCTASPPTSSSSRATRPTSCARSPRA